MVLEVCVDTLSAAEAAYRGGADRLEVCGDLSIGGVTPDRSLVQAIQEVCDLPIAMMVRPRGGDFVYTPSEIDQMLIAITMAKELAVQAVVFGVLDSDSGIDKSTTDMLIAAARPLEVVYHRAFDDCTEPLAALDYLVEARIDRLLTSGQQSIAADGVVMLKKLVERSDGKLTVMPGAGITPENIGMIAREVGAKEYHGSFKGPSGTTQYEVVAQAVAELSKV